MIVLGAQKLAGENLKVIWAKFSTLSWSVFDMSVIAWHLKARPLLELKIRHRFCPVWFSLSMQGSLTEGEGSVQLTSLY
jgi:hypothetical protein